MRRMVFVDACRLPKVAIKAVNHLQSGVVGNETFVVGVMPRIRWWEDQLEQGDCQFIRPLETAKGATRITLTMKVISMLPSRPDDTHWMIIGSDRAYVELVARLRKLGIDAEYLPSICMDQAISIVGTRPSIAQQMRELAREMLHGQKSHSVPVGIFANRAVKQVPELRKKKLRTDLFGACRFSSIAKNIGLRVADNRIIGVD